MKENDCSKESFNQAPTSIMQRNALTRSCNAIFTQPLRMKISGCYAA